MQQLWEGLDTVVERSRCNRGGSAAVVEKSIDECVYSSDQGPKIFLPPSRNLELFANNI